MYGFIFFPLSNSSLAQDKQADLVIHGYVDQVMTIVMKRLEVAIPEFVSGDN